jgi:two-component system KDP operon response regulator KdpE
MMKFLLIEDDPEIVEYISIAFELGWPSIKLITCHQGNKGIDIVEKESPDLVLLDLGLPDIDGYEVLKQIRLFSAVPMIIITARGAESDIVKGLERGADEYLVKPFGQLELIARIKALLRISYNQDFTGPIICKHYALECNPSTGQLKLGQNSTFLTRTECLILQKLIVNAGKVVTYEDLSETIWGCSYPNSTDTLRVYIKRIRNKIEKELQATGLIQSRTGIGYYLKITE